MVPGRVTWLVGSVVLGVALAACSAGGASGGGASVSVSGAPSAISASPAASGAGISAITTKPLQSGSATDIAFAQAMIPHHEQAVAMADMALDPAHGASPQVRALAAQIQAAQAPEIQLMTQWLQTWGAPTVMPSTTGDIATMDHGGHEMGSITMSGMMTTAQMQQLEQSSGTQFDQLWLTMMIAHHEGAITMAEAVQANSANPQVVALADAIIVAQQAEIAEMRRMLSTG